MIKEIQIYEEPVGKQWIKSIKFTFPILDGVDEISLDKESTVETVILLSRKKPDAFIEIDLEMSELDLTKAEAKATYEEIK